MKIVKKVWGNEKWIENNDVYCGKVLVLDKSYRCSLHHHKIKHETFYINKGKVLMEFNGQKYIMLPGEIQVIEPNDKHRFTGIENSEIIEFSTHHEDSDSYRDEPSGKVDLEEILKEVDENNRGSS